MKRLPAILLVLLYLSTNIGLGMNVHYCHGEVASVEFYSHQTHCCCGTMQMMQSCCDDRLLEFQIDDSQQAPAVLAAPDAPALAQVDILIEQSIDPLVDKDVVPAANDPPPESPPIYLLNCAFTFYG